MSDLSDEQAYRKYADELVRYATILVGPTLAADLVAETFLAVFRSPGWPAATQPRSYLYRAVLNQARQNHRATQRRLAREARATDAAEIAADDGGGARAEVLDALSRLTLRQRTVVFFTYWRDLTPAEIAAHIETSERTVQRDLRKAHNKLEGLLR